MRRLIAYLFNISACVLVLLCLSACNSDVFSGYKAPRLPDYQDGLNCSQHDNSRDFCNTYASCVFDKKSSKCVKLTDCSQFSNDANQCSQKPGCDFLKNLRKPSQGLCVSDRDKKPDCLQVQQKDHCELDGITNNKCVYVNSSCQNESNFNAQGFDPNGLHISGNFYNLEGFDRNGNYIRGGVYQQRDPQGYDAQGYNERGFNRNGLLADGRDRDARGFNAAGMHQNGSQYDAQGYNIQGYNVAGYNAAGLNRAGQHYSGHNALAQGHRLLQNDGSILINGANAIYTYGETEILGNVQVVNQVSRGIDQMGYSRQLPHRPNGADETFNKDGYNGAGLNYLGLTKQDFDAHGVDAILNLPEVQGYPNDFDQMVARFNASCAQLEYNHPIMMKTDWGDNYDNGGNLVQAAGFANKYYPILQTLWGNYNNPPVDDHDKKHFPMSKVLKDEHGALRDVAVVEQKFLDHLKKATYFCEKFLFAGALKPNNQGKVSFSHVRVSQSHMLTDLTPSADYKSYLEIINRPHQGLPSANFVAIIKNSLTDAILAEAVYTEDGDRLEHGTRGANGGQPNRQGGIVAIPRTVANNPGFLNVGVERGDINNALDGYRDNLQNWEKGYDYDKTRVYLRLIADKIGDDNAVIAYLQRAYGHGAYVANNAREGFAGVLAHCGRHCKDARRKTIEELAINLDPDGVRKVRELDGLILGKNNLSWILRGSLSPLKTEKYKNWIDGMIKTRNVFEALSTIAGTWAKYRRDFGIHAVEVAHNFTQNMDTAKFFEHRENAVPQAGQAANFSPNGGYSVQNIYLFMLNYMNSYNADANQSNQLQAIRNEIFGPLWFLFDPDPGYEIWKQGGNLFVEKHPIVLPLLVRLGILEKTN